MKILLFEDENAANLNPLVYTRPVYDLLCGMTCLKEKILRLWPGAEVYLHCRKDLAPVVAENNKEQVVNRVPSEQCLLINGRVLPDDNLRKMDLSKEVIYQKDGTIVAALLANKNIPKQAIETGQLLSAKHFSDQDRIPINANVIKYPWNIVKENPGQIILDFSAHDHGGIIDGEIYPNVTLINKSNIYVDKTAKIMPGVVLDAEAGPIYISARAKILANTVIEGPCFIGESTLIKIGAKIYEGCSFGPVCKVGGEVENSILHAFSNKQHEGFLGHAYVGEWCNFGADTNNSDLKNNYANVKVQINYTLVDTGSLFVGLFMGDHSKTGINTMFNTGTVVGVGCNIYGAGFPPRFIPSFSWGGSHILVKYDFDKTIETARVAMARRGKTLTPAMVELLKNLYKSHSYQALTSS